MSVLFRVYFIHLRRKVQRQDIQAALCYRQPERCVNTGSGDRQCLRRPTFGVEGQRADLLTVQCDLHPSAAFRGHTQCGIVLNTCSFFTHIMLAIHLPMQLFLRIRRISEAEHFHIFDTGQFKRKVDIFFFIASS